MSGVGRGRSPYLPRLAFGVLWLLVSACGEEEAPEEATRPPQEVAAVAQEEPAAEPGLRPFLPDEMQRSTRAESFPHPAHQEISCAVCHQSPRGHASHGDLTCSDCHRASQNARLTALTPADCQSCHHSPDQARSCETCHESRGAVVTEQELFLEVWSAPQARSFTFDHGLHTELSCESCHRALPALTPAESCASCHAEHHTTEVQCASCHTTDTVASHDVEAHLTCSGSGCHRVRDIEAISTSRNVCLACHVEQSSHEPGGNCIECHRVRAEPVAWATPAGWAAPASGTDWRHR